MPVLGMAKRIALGGSLPCLGDGCAALDRLSKSQYPILPGFCAVPVRLREPGLSYAKNGSHRSHHV